MKVKVVRSFIDKHTKERHKKGDTLNITEQRFREILRTGEFVVALSQKAQNDEKKSEDAEATNETGKDAESEEEPSDAPTDDLETMSIAELKEYADKAYKLTFKSGTKKSEIIEVLRRKVNG